MPPVRLQSDRERELSAALASALSGAVRRATFPKASVDVYAVVLEADGGELAVATSAAALALADAGIELGDLVSACSVVRHEHGRQSTCMRWLVRETPARPRWQTRASSWATWCPPALWCATGVVDRVHTGQSAGRPGVRLLCGALLA